MVMVNPEVRRGLTTMHEENELTPGAVLSFFDNLDKEEKEALSQILTMAHEGGELTPDTALFFLTMFKKNLRKNNLGEDR